MNYFPSFFSSIPFSPYPLSSVFVSIHDTVSQFWSLSLPAWIWFLSHKQPETIPKKKKRVFWAAKKKKKKKSEIWRRQRWEIIEDCDLRSSRGVHSVLLGFLWGISISHPGWFEKFLWLVGIIFCFSLNLIFINMFLEKTWQKKRNFTLDFEQWSRIK